MKLKGAVATAHDNKYVLAVYQDDDCSGTSRDWDNLGRMVCWHRHHTLGDVSGRELPSDPQEWMIDLAAELSGRDREVFDRLGDLYYARANSQYPSPYQYGHALPADVDKREREHRQAVRDARQAYCNKVMTIVEENAVILPLALLDHSGLHMYMGSGAHWSDPGGWDSGQVGWIYATKDQVIREYGEWSEESRQEAREVLIGEVETYDQDLCGDVYGFVLYTTIREPVGPDRDVEHAVIDDEPVWLEEVDSCWGFYGHDWSKGEIGGHLPEDARHLVDELE